MAMPMELDVDIFSNFGCRVKGLDLKASLSTQCINQIIDLLSKYKILLIKNDLPLNEKEQVQLSQAFGNLENSGFIPHPKSGHESVLHISNDPDYGLQNFGTSGFHIDCSFLEKPNYLSIYNMVHASEDGGTVFVDLCDLVNNLARERLAKWKRLSIVITYKYIKRKTEKPGYVVHPLIFQHPVTAKPSLCIHQGHTSGFIYDRNTEHAKKTSKEETRQILLEIDEELQKQTVYRHKWRPGDVLISDNLALAHIAPESTQKSPEDVGLRLMMRTLVKGSKRLEPYFI